MLWYEFSYVPSFISVSVSTAYVSGEQLSIYFQVKAIDPDQDQL